MIFVSGGGGKLRVAPIASPGLGTVAMGGMIPLKMSDEIQERILWPQIFSKCIIYKTAGAQASGQINP